MPGVFQKTLVPIGTHQSPEGPVRVTPERIQHWHDSYYRMRARGIKVPVPWGHRQEAFPDESPDDSATARAKWNAGYVDQLSIDPHTGSLTFAMKPPPGLDVDDGDLIDPVNHTRIGEVSAGIGDWKDGKGTWWKDIIFHAALTPLPVSAGQDGFSLPATTGSDGFSLTRLAADPARVVWRHSLSTRTGEPAMAKEDEKPEGKKPDEPAAKKADAEVEAETVEIPPEPKPEGDEDFNECLALLKEKMDVTLPEDIKKSDFFKMFKVALMNAKCEPAANGGSPDVPADTANATAEQPPIMMSTKPGKPAPVLTDREKRAAGKLAVKERERLIGEVDQLATLGVPPAICDRYRTTISRQNMSLNPETMVVSLPAVNLQIEAVKEVLTAINPDSAQLLKTLSTATPERSPVNAPETEAEKQAWRDKEAERMYGPGAKAAVIA